MKRTVFKLLVAGDASVGKTTLLHRFIQGEFIDTTTMTIGVDFFTKKLELPNMTCMLQLWDIGGQERFRFMVENYLRGAHGALLLFDTTSMASFVSIQKWNQLLRRDNPGLPIILVGTKKDLEEYSMVGDYYAKKTQEKFRMIDYIKTSSKLDFNVDKAFKQMVQHLLKTSLTGWEDVEYEREKKMKNLKQEAERLEEEIEGIMQQLFHPEVETHVKERYDTLREKLDEINAQLTALQQD
ncbi:MAG: GTP-binding protein [Promethearchaeota archaeon]|nr:MAG: GTP-binding protein [Candidatus Lokiarchaeota archaeon]